MEDGVAWRRFAAILEGVGVPKPAAELEVDALILLGLTTPLLAADATPPLLNAPPPPPPPLQPPPLAREGGLMPEGVVRPDMGGWGQTDERGLP